ncbi:FmdB family zinc ribbon protein [Pseudonocardia sp. TRM90224]|uniref:FmdB family zinc ribbon protein n=1 Tax=Pseudonocardia sp. TRM90224 TaxID=2812678 RepID=UPI001E4C33FE|nr:FmdB family zinc ribbon protein [Pseudonocardia sp. TRM90224]
MATYTYRCGADGPVDVRRPIGTAPETIDCPACGGPSARMITAPMLGLADRGRMAVLDRTEASRFEPPVVSSIPTEPRTRGRRPDPRTARLPRP